MKQENCKMTFNFTFASSAPLRLINQGLEKLNRKDTERKGDMKNETGEL